MSDQRLVDEDLSPLELRVVVLSRIRGGSWRPVRHTEADEMLEALASTPRRPGATSSLLAHAEGVLWEWYERLGLFLPRSAPNPGASRVMPDRVRLLGWLADVHAVILDADRHCTGGSGQAVMDAIDAAAMLDFARSKRAAESEQRDARNRMTRRQRRLARKIGMAWIASSSRMQRL